MDYFAYFKRFKDLQIIDSADLMYTSLVNNSSFLEAYPFMTAKLALLKGANEIFRNAYHDALTKDVLKVEWRKAKRDDLHHAMGTVAQFAVAAAGDDPSVLNGTGIEVRRKRNASSHAQLQAPSNFTVKHGSIRGTIVGKVNKLDGAGGYEMYVTEVEPTLEEGWKFFASYVGSSRMEMTGFLPGKNYFFRVRGVSSSGPGPWSAVVALISI